MKMTARPLTHVLAACLALSSWSALAAYLESGPADEDAGRIVPEPAPRPLPRPIPRHELRSYVDRLSVGRPTRSGALTIYPVNLGNYASHGRILTLDDALNRGWLVVRESDRERVSALSVRNDAADPVLLLAGEVLVGGKQNRLIRADALLPSRSTFIDVEVYCVEQDRWQGKPTPFSSPAGMGDQWLRRKAVGGASQAEIWLEIDTRLESEAVRSATRDYAAVAREPAVAKRIDDLWHRCRRLPQRRTVGAVVMVGDRIVSADLFSDPDLFARSWRKLCRSYAAAPVPEHRIMHHDARPRQVERFLRSIADARLVNESRAGAGTAYRVEGAATGAALFYGSPLVHLTAYP